ncbi:nitrous oxide reductase accessory protein NosL [Bacillaceae bacterium IKA-2]|jgi:copper chaperone NosL|nr:nitrous oxide reductase accessory protein NosL [Bacillaceae bacterium IKA-2]
MKKSILLMVGLLMIFVVASCGSSDEVFPPEEVQAGVDRCEHCNMLVPDDLNATQLILNDGRSLKFDDIGCMVEWVMDSGLEDVNVRYVRDYSSEEWFEMEQATFVYHKEFRTPMAYGIFSFSSKDAADAFVIEQGKGIALTYADLEGHTWERDMEMMQHMKKEMGSHGHGTSDDDHDDEEETD